MTEQGTDILLWSLHMLAQAYTHAANTQMCINHSHTQNLKGVNTKTLHFIKIRQMVIK